MKKMTKINRTASNLKRVLLASFCLGMIFGIPSVSQAMWWWWLRR